MILSLICVILSLLIDGKTRLRFPVLLVPVLLFLLLIGLQLRTYAPEALAVRSPKAAELREQLLPAPDSEEYAFAKEIYPETQSNADPATKSVYPAATRHQLSLFVLAVSAFFSAAVLFRNRIEIIGFTVMASINGCLLALVGIIMRLRPYGDMFFYLNNAKNAFSTFLNKNNAAGYLGMCLGATVILLLYCFFRTERESTEHQQWERAYLSQKQILLQSFSRFLSPVLLTLGLLAGITLTGVLVSMSRGGCLAVAVALCVSILAVLSTRRLKSSLVAFAIVSVLGLGLVFWVGMGENVQKRLESITSDDADGVRSLNWSNAMKTAEDFHWRGTGLGTYQYANLLNDELAATTGICVRAENQYVEIFLELGIWGFLLLIASLVIVIVLCIRLIWRRHDDWSATLGGGLLVVMIVQAVASIFDFGLYIVANSLFFAVCCGILSATMIPSKREDIPSSPEPPPTWGNHFHRFGLFATGCLFLVLLGMGRKEIQNIYRIDLAMERLETVKDYRTVPIEELSDAISNLDAAIQYRPDSAVALAALSEAQIGMYRRAIYDGIKSEFNEDTAWNLTTLNAIHTAAGRLRRIGITGKPLQAILETAESDKYLRPAFANLVRSRQSNVMDINVHYRIAELVPILDKQGNLQEYDQPYIDRMTLVAPWSAISWFRAGSLKRNLGHSAQAQASWKQSLSLSDRYLGSIAQITRADMRGDNSKTLFESTFPNSSKIYHTLLTQQFTKRNAPDFYEIALDQYRKSCETAGDIPEDEHHYYSGRYYMLVGDYETAIKEIRMACQMQQSKHGWRRQLAEAYYLNQQFEEAKKEIDRALFYDPGNKNYASFRDRVVKMIK